MCTWNKKNRNKFGPSTEQKPPQNQINEAGHPEENAKLTLWIERQLKTLRRFHV